MAKAVLKEVCMEGSCSSWKIASQMPNEIDEIDLGLASSIGSQAPTDQRTLPHTEVVFVLQRSASGCAV